MGTFKFALAVCLACTISILPVVAALPGDEEMAQAAHAAKTGDHATAEKQYQEAIEKFRINKRYFPLAFALDELGNVYLQQNKLDEAAYSYDNALEIRKASLASGKDDNGKPLSATARKSINKDLGLVTIALGSVYTRQTKLDRAERTLIRGLGLIKANWGPQDDCVGVALAALGDLKFAQGSYAEADRFYREALSIRRKYHAVTDPALAPLLKNRAAVVKILRKHP